MNEDKLNCGNCKARINYSDKDSGFLNGKLLCKDCFRLVVADVELEEKEKCICSEGIHNGNEQDCACKCHSEEAEAKADLIRKYIGV